MSLGRAPIFGMLMMIVLAPAARTAVGPPGREILELTDLVHYLKSRVRSEAPGPVTDKGVLSHLLREELERFDMVLPEASAVDFESDDLKIAGVLLEEQHRRRRQERRAEIMSETDIILSREVEALLQDAEKYVPEFAPEIADIFRSIHRERLLSGEVEVTRIHPAAMLRRAPPPGSPAPVEAVAAPQPVAAPTPTAVVQPVAPVASRFPRPGGIPPTRYEALREELQAALVQSVGDWHPADDPFFGDQGFVVPSPDAPAPKVSRPAARRPSRANLLAKLRKRVMARRKLLEEARTQKYVAAPPVVVPEPSPTQAPEVPTQTAPAPVLAREVTVPPPSRDVAVPAPRLAMEVRRKARTEPTQVVRNSPQDSGETPSAGLVALMDHLVPALRVQVEDDEEFTQALIAALDLLGVRAPTSWTPVRSQTSQELAAGFRTAGGPRVAEAAAACAVFGI